MAATDCLALILSEPSNVEKSVTEKLWQVSFSRFLLYPSLPSTCPSLLPLPHTRYYRPSRGTWISSRSPSASLLLHHRPSSASDSILTVCFHGQIMEEHYVSKLQFSWPQVSCVSGYPPRGSRYVFISYKDSNDEIQKFAVRFSVNTEAENFINALKDILQDPTGIEPPISDIRSDISSEPMFRSADRISARTYEEESSVMTPVQTSYYQPEISFNLNCEVEQDSHTNEQDSHTNEEESSVLPPVQTSYYQPEITFSLNCEVEQDSHTNKDTLPNSNSKDIYSALPPSFASFLSNCCSDVQQVATQPSSAEDVDLKSQIVRCMEDSSFQEMLMKVEKVIAELGDEMML
ncbi:protein POOR HOMOLOGOUS SYNAPSIS 1-like [Mercurialis annua]|uniref:protein POOR HOMOLOGOUS SYNAPSIS 1-like n=1 Tax=Mercurialis annua TaxID=3986 RepID=UPI00215E2FD4|nr:protein POOR HOMOLOGOUS SYNAPSIS 1-like [Mercurialis annua]XP_050204720.1 protein POOR HOMOLOGOUS SYNAPSIS 1-like [Mercurialis annua]